MRIEEFEKIAEEEYNALPAGFKERIENLRIVVEEIPNDHMLRSVDAHSEWGLLGLYQGIPLTRRNTGYGMYPVVPDTITLFKRNIEALVGRDERRVREKIREVLIHEIAHHFGMNEDEIRAAGY